MRTEILKTLEPFSKPIYALDELDAMLSDFTGYQPVGPAQVCSCYTGAGTEYWAYITMIRDDYEEPEDEQPEE